MSKRALPWRCTYRLRHFSLIRTNARPCTPEQCLAARPLAKSDGGNAAVEEFLAWRNAAWVDPSQLAFALQVPALVAGFAQGDRAVFVDKLVFRVMFYQRSVRRQFAYLRVARSCGAENLHRISLAPMLQRCNDCCICRGRCSL